MSDANTTTTTPTSPQSERIRYGALAVVAGLVVLGVITALLLRDSPKVSASPSGAISVSGEVVTIAPDAPQWQYLALVTAEEGAPLQPLPVPGRVEFDENRSASVGTPLQGRVEKVLVRFGDRVKKGQRLFSVRSAAYADLDRELASAREAVVVKQRVMERVTDLVKLQAAPEKERLAAEAEFKEAQLTLKVAQAKQGSLAVSGESDNLFWVTAPRDGTIVEHDMFASQEVGPDRERPLLRISDLDEVIVIGDVAERDAADLKVGTDADIAVGAAGATRKGTVERVSEVVDPRRHTVEIRIRVRNEDRALRPNALDRKSVV